MFLVDTLTIVQTNVVWGAQLVKWYSLYMDIWLVQAVSVL